MNREEVIQAGQGASLTTIERDVGPSGRRPNVAPPPTPHVPPQEATQAALLQSILAPQPALSDVLSGLESGAKAELVVGSDPGPANPGPANLGPSEHPRPNQWGQADIQNLQAENAKLQSSLRDAGVNVNRIGKELHELKGEHSKLTEAYHSHSSLLKEAKEALQGSSGSDELAARENQIVTLGMVVAAQAALLAGLLGPKP